LTLASTQPDPLWTSELPNGKKSNLNEDMKFVVICYSSHGELMTHIGFVSKPQIGNQKNECEFSIPLMEITSVDTKTLKVRNWL
jgi:hypothetical protein